MTPANQARLIFLLETVEKESRHLLGTTERLFVEPIDVAWVSSLEQRPELAERVDAYNRLSNYAEAHLGSLAESRPSTLAGEP